MMRRLTRSAFQVSDDPSPPKKIPFREDLVSLGHLDPPIVKNVTHHSVELEWAKAPWSSKKFGNKLKYALLEEDKNTKGSGTVYIGYGTSYVVEGLEPLQNYRYRLKVTDPSNEESRFSAYIDVRTAKEPYNGMHLHKAVSQRNIEQILAILSSQTVSIEVTDELGYTPLMNASQKKYLDVANTLLEHGADVNAQNASGRNSLMLACFGGSLEIVERLRVAGATWNSSDRGGSFPIHWAVDGGNLQLVEWMLSEGADVNVRDNTAGWTPLLRCSALSGNVEMARVLIKNGAKVNTADNDGKTTLMNATLNGHTDLVKELVANRADLNVKNKYGKCAIDMARSFDRRKILEYFEGIIEQSDT